MDCRAYESDLKDHAAERLAPAREAGLRAHLETCASCRAALAAEQGWHKTLDVALLEEINAPIPAGLAPRLLLAAEALREHEPRRAPWTQVLAASAVTAAFLLVVALYWRGSSPARSQGVAVPPSVVAQSRPQEPGAVPGDAPRHGSGAGFAIVRKPVRASAKAKEPEVLVPAEEGAALEQIVEGLRQRRVSAETLLFLADASGDKPLRVAPLEISPLNVRPLEEDSKE
jgi:hypothetical protein